MTGHEPDAPGGIRIDRLPQRRAAEAGAVLAASHAEYPAFRHLFPDPGVRARVLRLFTTATARDAARHGILLAATGRPPGASGGGEGSGAGGEGGSGGDAPGVVLGVALWMPPGTFPLSRLRKARMTPALMRVAAVSPRRFAAFARTGSTLEREHPGRPAWYLQAMGVRPDAQRRGIGSRLMRPALDEADQQGAPCHLHTSDPANAGYYRRFGFEVTRPHAPIFEGGPAYLHMTRPPRPSQR